LGGLAALGGCAAPGVEMPPAVPATPAEAGLLESAIAPFSGASTGTLAARWQP